jgi:PBP superfamily domain
VLQRSSQAALELLAKGLVHAAGVHLARADEPDGNLPAVRDFFRPGPDHRLLRVADWDEGIALAPGLARLYQVSHARSLGIVGFPLVFLRILRRAVV